MFKTFVDKNSLRTPPSGEALRSEPNPHTNLNKTERETESVRFGKVKTVDLSGFEKMGEKIGFGYEAICQRALWEGVLYLSKVDRPDKILDKTLTFKNIYGITETPESAKELEAIWSKLDKEVFKGWTGAQHQCVVGHLRQIAKHGISWWLEQFKNEPDRIFEIDLDDLFKQTSYHNYMCITLLR